MERELKIFIGKDFCISPSRVTGMPLLFVEDIQGNVTGFMMPPAVLKRVLNLEPNDERGDVPSFSSFCGCAYDY
jgi:hypothetical protein